MTKCDAIKWVMAKHYLQRICHNFCTPQIFSNPEATWIAESEFFIYSRAGGIPDLLGGLLKMRLVCISRK